ncbi:MAG: tRNA lysidine(34) synthetase TilS [Acidobacteria bacterium]|nr:tRNA lysidine(34) synthetase TilS [Acidobacteriota bacterium]
MSAVSTLPFSIDLQALRPGMRIAAAVSGGADSVALLRLLAHLSREHGIVVSAAHVHHGIRGEEADRDADFTSRLAARLGLPFLRHDVDTPAHAAAQRETMEEAARNLRYAWFRQLLDSGIADAVATAHTLDDQAETVLHRLLRGAWTEGLSGIHPTLAASRGFIFRPLLGVRRAQVEGYLRDLGQDWCEDSTNRDAVYTRNRIRHQLLPVLADYNPQLARQMANLATIARDEEHYWQAELDRLLPSLLLPGKPVRGGGRAASTQPGEASLAIEIERLRPLAPALRRRVLRAAARRLGHALDFDQTARLLAMCGFESGAPARREVLSAQLIAERTPRELRLLRTQPESAAAASLPEYTIAVPGEILAPAFCLRLSITAAEALPAATLRAPRSGDRVRLRYTSAPKRLKEVFERLRIPAAERASWPILEWQGQIVWMRGADVENTSPLTVLAEPLS